MFLYIKIGSVTNAQRAAAVLRKNRIKAQIIRMENPQPGDGCGYMIKVRKEEGDSVHILQNNGIRILGVVDE